MSSWTTLLEASHCSEDFTKEIAVIVSQSGLQQQRLTNLHFFSLSADPVTNAIKTRRHDSDHILTLLKGVLKERDEGQLSGPYQAPPSWEVEMSPLPPHYQQERDRATALVRWNCPEAAASAAFAFVTENDDVMVRLATVSP